MKKFLKEFVESTGFLSLLGLVATVLIMYTTINLLVKFNASTGWGLIFFFGALGAVSVINFELGRRSFKNEIEDREEDKKNV